MDRDSHLIYESYFANKMQLLNEVDWEKFKDVQKICLSPDQVADELNSELERLKLPEKERPKAKTNFPRISKGNIPTEEGRINIEQFIKNISERPKTIFDIGEKSEHSADESSITINTGIPALRAVLWDTDNKEFYVINTCPGAGECAKICYAMKGFYILSDGKNMKLVRRLQLMMNNPEEYERIAYNEAELYAVQANQQNKQLKLRWNDAGDLFSDVYFNIVLNVTRKLQSKYNVESYAYTKIAKYIKAGEENGIVMNFSSGAKSSEREKMGSDDVKYSEIVDKQIFKGIFVPSGSGYKKDQNGKTLFKKENTGRDDLKQIIYNNYKDNKVEGVTNLTYDSLKYTDELPSEEGEKFKYNVIVLPSGDSDRPAQRRDVKYTFLLQH